MLQVVPCMSIIVFVMRTYLDFGQAGRRKNLCSNKVCELVVEVSLARKNTVNWGDFSHRRENVAGHSDFLL